MESRLEGKRGRDKEGDSNRRTEWSGSAAGDTSARDVNVNDECISAVIGDDRELLTASLQARLKQTLDFVKDLISHLFGVIIDLKLGWKPVRNYIKTIFNCTCP